MKILRILFLVFIIAGLSGCLESSFLLSQNSRIPKWFDVPADIPRSEIKVTADYYSTFHGAKDVYKIYDNQHFFHLQKVTASTQDGNWAEAVQLEYPPEGPRKGYPRYRVITINGITDIIEHRKMEPIFYMTDDIKIWEELAPVQ